MFIGRYLQRRYHQFSFINRFRCLNFDQFGFAARHHWPHFHPKTFVNLPRFGYWFQLNQESLCHFPHSHQFDPVDHLSSLHLNQFSPAAPHLRFIIIQSKNQLQYYFAIWSQLNFINHQYLQYWHRLDSKLAPPVPLSGRSDLTNRARLRLSRPSAQWNRCLLAKGNRSSFASGFHFQHLNQFNLANQILLFNWHRSKPACRH